jgi:predicted ATPase/class 3 adenylate cyclase
MPSTLTFLFTDIEGSTRRWECFPEAMQQTIARHDQLIQDAVEAHSGRVFKTVGDACCAVFSRPRDAVEAALSAQRAIAAEEWAAVDTLSIRAALYTGTAQERGGDYFGQALNRVARLLSSAHGGQTVLSATTAQEVRECLPGELGLLDLGEHRFKDLTRPEHVFQLVTPDARTEFPVLNSLDAKRTNLPIQATPLIGRQKEVRGVGDLIRREDVRLVTLTGPGGTGKTRLALQAGAELLEGFKDGVYFVPLATLTDPESIVGAIADSLSLRQESERSLDETLKSYLQSQRMLLVIDNFEHVVEGGPSIASLLRDCPGVKALVTSRIPLQVYGEREFAVPPMAVPDVRRLPAFETVLEFESVRLFEQRAQAVKRDFALTPETAPTVVEICQRLDGLPLAIELAAVRVKLLPPKALLERLGQGGLRLLTGGARDLPERQQTLRNTIDWSYRLLGHGDQRLFARCAVFVGGWSLEAAEAVCETDGDVDVFDGIASLVEKSLVRQVEQEDNEPRFVMLETIREYAAELMESSSAAGDMRQRQCEYYLGLAESAPPNFTGADQEVWLGIFQREHDNIRAALRHALGTGDGETAGRLALATSRFWKIRGHFDEGRGWLRRALALTETPTILRGRLLYRAGSLAAGQADYAEADRLETQAAALAREVGDTQTVGDALNIMGTSALARGADDLAGPLFRESLTLTREVGDDWGSAACLINLGNMALGRASFEEAQDLFTQSLVLWRSLSDTWGVAFCIGCLGALAVYRDEFDRATGLLRESLELRRALGDNLGAAFTMSLLGLAQGRLGSYEQAEDTLVEALNLVRELGNVEMILDVLQHFATLMAMRGEAATAGRLWAAVDALGAANGISPNEAERRQYERDIESAQRRLDPSQWNEAWEEGRSLTLDGAVAIAVGLSRVP